MKPTEPENTVVVLDAAELAAFKRVVMLAQSRLADRACEYRERCQTCGRIEARP